MYRDPEAKKAIADHADADEAEEGEEAQEDAAVQNTMKTFEGEGAADEEEEGEDDGENWAQGQTAGTDYAKWAFSQKKWACFSNPNWWLKPLKPTRQNQVFISFGTVGWRNYLTPESTSNKIATLFYLKLFDSTN